jgi:alpha-beta hydrolase superfamily lysophospholipase
MSKVRGANRRAVELTRRMKSKWLRRFCIAAATLFVVMNAVAFYHSYRMLHFVPAGEKTRAPTRLSRWQRWKVLVTGVVVPKPASGHRADEIGPVNRAVTITARDGARLALWDVADAGNGTNPAVVLLFHGYGTDKGTVIAEARVWRELGCRTVLVDFRGAGDSEGSVSTLGWREALDVSAAVAWTRREYPGRRLILHGQSMGAAAVLRAMATDGVRADAVVLETPFDRMETTIGHRFDAMNLPSWPFAQLMTFWGGAQFGFNAFTHNPVEYARSVDCPALVIEGDRDPWVRVEEAKAVAAALRGPVRVQIFEGQGHGGYARHVPEMFRRVVRDWLVSAGAIPPA